jgi:hypothetical protein
MDFLDRLRLRENQKVVVALLVAGASGKSLAAEMAFVKTQALDFGAHRTVEDEDALTSRGLECRENLRAIASGGFGTKEFVEHGTALHHFRIAQ